MKQDKNCFATGTDDEVAKTAKAENANATRRQYLKSL